MVFPANLLANLHGFDEERLGLGIIPHFVIQHSEIVQAGGVAGMALLVDLIVNLHGFDEERLGLGIIPHFLVQRSKIVQAGGRRRDGSLQAPLCKSP